MSLICGLDDGINLKTSLQTRFALLPQQHFHLEMLPEPHRGHAALLHYLQVAAFFFVRIFLVVMLIQDIIIGKYLFS